MSLDGATSRTGRCNLGSGAIDAAVIERPRDLLRGLPTTGGPGARKTFRFVALHDDEADSPDWPPAQRLDGHGMRVTDMPLQCAAELIADGRRVTIPRV
jgi:hypothetical protein